MITQAVLLSRKGNNEWNSVYIYIYIYIYMTQSEENSGYEEMDSSRKEGEDESMTEMKMKMKMDDWEVSPKPLTGRKLLENQRSTISGHVGREERGEIRHIQSCTDESQTSRYSGGMGKHEAVISSRKSIDEESSGNIESESSMSSESEREPSIIEFDSESADMPNPYIGKIQRNSRVRNSILDTSSKPKPLFQCPCNSCPCWKRKIHPEIPTATAKRHVPTNPKNRFSGLTGKMKSDEIKRVFRKAVRRIVIRNAFMNARHLNRFQTIKKYQRNTILDKQRECLILPGTTFSIIWTFVVLGLLLYTAIVTPFSIAFIDNPPLGFIIFEIIIDFLFMTDIIINFFTPYYSKGVLIKDKAKIAKNYIKSWFFIDLIACIPFNLISSGDTASNTNYNKLLRLMRVARIYRLLRLFRLFKLTKMNQMSNKIDSKFALTLKINPSLGGMIQALVALIFFVHLFGCFWFLTAKMPGFPPDSWVVRYSLRDSSMWEQYLASVYWVLQTITTVGYGDIYALTNWERLFGLVVMLFGVGFYSFTIGNATALVSQVDYHQRKIKSQLSTLVEFSKKTKLPNDIIMKIRSALEEKQSSKIGQRDQEYLLEQLPSTLKAEVLTHTHKELYQQVPFFRGKNPHFLWELLPRLHSLSVKKGELLYWEGDIAEEMFFLVEGGVDMISSEGYIYKTFNDGTYFGQMELLDKTTRTATSKASDDCQLLIIKKNDFFHLMNEYQEIKLELVESSHKRKKAKIKLIVQAKKFGFRLSKIQREEIFNKEHITMFNRRFTKFQRLTLGATDIYPQMIEQKERMEWEKINSNKEGLVSQNELPNSQNYFKRSSVQNRDKTFDVTVSPKASMKKSSGKRKLRKKSSSPSFRGKKAKLPLEKKDSPSVDFTQRKTIPITNIDNNNERKTNAKIDDEEEKVIKNETLKPSLNRNPNKEDFTVSYQTKNVLQDLNNEGMQREEIENQQHTTHNPESTISNKNNENTINLELFEPNKGAIDIQHYFLNNEKEQLLYNIS